MRGVEDKGCLNNGATPEISGGSCISFDFHKRNGVNHRASHHHRTALGKPTPSKWDDAQKWLVNLSRGEKNQAKASPRNSNADDRRLIVPVPKKDYSSDEEEPENGCPASDGMSRDEAETKTVDCDESVWRISKPVDSSKSVVRSVCVRDMGTEMTPISSQEPSRAGTPIRANTPAPRSPIAASEPASSLRCQNGLAVAAECEAKNEPKKANGEEQEADNMTENMSKTTGQSRNMNALEIRATAWDEAERAKYMARYKREEVKIQAWENHVKRKAEMEMRKTEAKAERLKSRAQEKYTNKLASTRRIAEEQRANAEAKLNEMAVKTSERADYIRRTGHLPSTFSFKLPSCCW